MEGWKRHWIATLLFFMTTLIIALTFNKTMSRTVYITLPDTEKITKTTAQDSTAESETLTLVTITPRTVQAAISALSRLPSYHRTLTITHFWENDSNSYTVSVSVSFPWTHIDLQQANGNIRHSLTDGKTCYVWYNDEKICRQLPAGNFTADNEQHIPTYEDILNLQVKDIFIADYRTFSDLNCIYVETITDEIGYSNRYWIDVKTGLLVFAEKLSNGNLIYRMSALTLEKELPADAFTLPNGMNLLSNN